MGAADQGANETHQRWLTIPRTLCFVLNGDDLLLMKRSPRRRVFPNRYNGVGGHIEKDEHVYAAAKREILEETGLSVTELTLRGIHNINAGQQSGILLFVFTAISTSRDIAVTHDEGTLHWIPRHHVDSLDLVEDLPYILPRVMEMAHGDAPYFAHVRYNERDEIIMTFADDIANE